MVLRAGNVLPCDHAGFSGQSWNLQLMQNIFPLLAQDLTHHTKPRLEDQYQPLHLTRYSDYCECQTYQNCVCCTWPLVWYFHDGQSSFKQAIKLVALTISCHCKGKTSVLLNSEELASWLRTHLKEKVAHSWQKLTQLPKGRQMNNCYVFWDIHFTTGADGQVEKPYRLVCSLISILHHESFLPQELSPGFNFSDWPAVRGMS